MTPPHKSKTTDEIVAELRELRLELFKLIGRVSRLENRIEDAIEAPPIEKRVVPASVVGAAAQLGEELAEGRRLMRGARDSARSLQRAVSPEDDTGAHRLEPSASKPEK